MRRMQRLRQELLVGETVQAMGERPGAPAQHTLANGSPGVSVLQSL